MKGSLAKQLKGAVFIYLTLSGHAMRETNTAVDTAQKVSEQLRKMGGEVSARAPAFDNFNVLLKAFSEKPSMKMSVLSVGTGPALFRGYLAASKKDREVIKEHMFFGLEEYLDGYDDSEEALAVELLNDGMSQWIWNQQNNPNMFQRRDYKGCKFDIAQLKDVGSLSSSNFLDVAKKLYLKDDLEAGRSPRKCKIIDMVEEFVGKSAGTTGLDMEETMKQQADAAGLASMLEVSSQDLSDMDAEFLSVLIGALCAVIIVFLIGKGAAIVSESIAIGERQAGRHGSYA